MDKERTPLRSLSAAENLIQIQKNIIQDQFHTHCLYILME